MVCSLVFGFLLLLFNSVGHPGGYCILLCVVIVLMVTWFCGNGVVLCCFDWLIVILC